MWGWVTQRGSKSSHSLIPQGLQHNPRREERIWESCPLCQASEGNLKSQDIQTQHLLENKFPMGLKQSHFCKATVRGQHTGDGTWMHRAPLQHWGTTGTWQLSVSSQMEAHHGSEVLPGSVMQLAMLQEAAPSACRPGHPAEPGQNPLPPAERKGISCMGRGRS